MFGNLFGDEAENMAYLGGLKLILDSAAHRTEITRSQLRMLMGSRVSPEGARRPLPLIMREWATDQIIARFARDKELQELFARSLSTGLTHLMGAS